MKQFQQRAVFCLSGSTDSLIHSGHGSFHRIPSAGKRAERPRCPLPGVCSRFPEVATRCRRRRRRKRSRLPWAPGSVLPSPQALEQLRGKTQKDALPCPLWLPRPDGKHKPPSVCLCSCSAHPSTRQKLKFDSVSCDTAGGRQKSHFSKNRL